MNTIANDVRLREVLRHVGHGESMIAAEKPADALAAFQAALALNPEDARLHSKIGLAYRRLGDAASAIDAYRKAVALDPASVVALLNLGTLYDEGNSYDLAIDCYRKALALKPRSVDALHYLSKALSQLGMIEDAIAATQNVLAIAPDDPKAHHRLMRLTRQVPEDNLRALEAAYRNSLPGSENRRLLAYAVGEMLERRECYADAMRHFLEANAIRRAGFDYDTAMDRDRFASIKATYDPGLFARLQGTGHADPTPIFIVGMPRSGTTLVEQILASHPRVHGAGELMTFGELAEGIDPATATPEVFADLGRRYVARIRQGAPDAEFITDKLPHNFRHLGLIRLALPNARIIHLRRDPGDTCLSIFKARFEEVHHYACTLAELGRYYTLYHDLMAHWHDVLPPGAIHDFDYEYLVHNQEAGTRALLDHCGLEWDDACLDFHKTTRRVTTVSIGQVHRQVYTTSVGLSRRYGAALAPLFEALGEASVSA